MHRPWDFGGPRRGALVLALGAAVMAVGSLASAANSSFPYDRELLLDAVPMKGSKRLPSLDIGANGATEIELWCNAVRAQIVVVEDTITIMTGAKTERRCPPDRIKSDEGLLSLLLQVTNWRREGDLLILTGPRTLRFRLQTN